MRDADADTRRLSREALAAGRPTGWFEPLYSEAADGTAIVPWDRPGANVRLIAYAESVGLRGDGRRAAVVGCGFGRDAEYLATLGFAVTAFDVSATAIAGARERHGTSSVSYEVGDLLALPPAWRDAFDLVLESHNVQALPDPPRPAAIAGVRSLLAPGATLLVFAAGRADDSAEPNGPPWPLLRREVESFAAADVSAVEITSDVDDEAIMRWRAVFTRAR